VYAEVCSVLPLPEQSTTVVQAVIDAYNARDI
jgi:hypothetical protein